MVLDVSGNKSVASCLVVERAAVLLSCCRLAVFVIMLQTGSGIFEALFRFNFPSTPQNL